MRWLSDTIGDYLWSFWEVLRDGSLQLWGAIVVCSLIAFEGFTLIGDMTITAIQALAGVGGWAQAAGSQGITDGALSPYFAVANTVFPLDEMVRLMAAMVTGVWLPIGLYRLAKSWLPAGWAGGS